MRNRYPGTCYRCHLHCAVGDGHFEKYGTGWRVQHANCAIRFRAERVVKETTPNERTRARKLRRQKAKQYG